MLRFVNSRVIVVDNMQQNGKGKKDEIPLIKPKAGTAKGPSIPDSLMVEPDENTKKMEMQKQQLLEAIKPTEKSISAVWILILPLLCTAVAGYWARTARLWCTLVDVPAGSRLHVAGNGDSSTRARIR